MTLPLNNLVLRKYNVGPVKSWVQAAADYIGTKFGLTTIGGWRKSDPFPDHPSGHALDFMISSKAQGDAVAQELMTHWRELGVKYIIWYRRTWNPQRGTWAPYTSTSNPHTDHVHATFNDTPGTASGQLSTLLGLSTGGGLTGLAASGGKAPDTCAWNLTAPEISQAIPILPDIKIGGQSFCLLSKVQVRVLFSLLVTGAGITLGMLGVVVLVAYGLKATGIEKGVMDVASMFPGAGKAATVAKAASAKSAAKTE